MAFNVKNDEADRLLRELTALTGESLTDAVMHSLQERLERERRSRCLPPGDRLTTAIAEFRALPVVDERSEDQILGYDDRGIPA